MSQLKRAAVAIGIPAEGFYVADFPIIKRGHSVGIIRLRPENRDWHFVTVTESKDQFVRIIDFPAKPAWIPTAALKDDLNWDGNILLMGDRIQDVAISRQRYNIADWMLWSSCGIVWIVALCKKSALHKLRIERPSLRKGFTLIELMVVLSVISVLMSLLLPAVQNARDRARSLECSSRLRQIGLGVHQYLDVHKGIFPVPFTRNTDRVTGLIIDRNMSVHAQLLPYLDQSAIYAKICFDETAAGAYHDPPFSDCNEAVDSLRVSTFECPSDSVNPGGTNFRVCFGSSPNFGVASEQSFLSFGAGMCTLSLVTDGLSNTAYFSERVSGDRNKASYDPTRDMVPTSGVPDSPKAQMADCAKTITQPKKHYSWIGSTWLLTHENHTSYSHAFPPNSAIPDCNVMVSARSWHLSSVNVLRCDGSVRSVSNTIDHDVWIAMASPCGGEANTEF